MGKGKRSVGKGRSNLKGGVNIPKLVYEDVVAASFDILSDEVKRLLSDLQRIKPLNEQTELVRKIYRHGGTDVEFNKSDPFGDGDQSPVQTEPQKQIYREMWNIGADIGVWLQFSMLMSPLMQLVLVGDSKGAEAMLKATKAGSKERSQLLECRETGFRWTPLLACIGLTKFIQLISQVTRRQVQSHKETAKVLIKYGARVDARDVSGKNATHYGAGSLATEDSLQITAMCIEAAYSCEHMGKYCTLKGLTKKDHNGLEVVLCGYVADTGRRVVILNQGKNNEREMAVRPENIYFNDSCIVNKSYKIVDVPDRLNYVVLHEVIMSQRSDVARFLLFEHGASLDVGDPSVRTMTMKKLGGGHGPVIQVARDYIATEYKKVSRCEMCGKAEDEKGQFQRCSACGDARYCSRDCQVSHWPQHRSNCRTKGVRVLSVDSYKRREKSDEQQHLRKAIANVGAGTTHGIAYAKPKNTKVNEKFWIKIQVSGSRDSLLIYDKSRECCFSLHQGEPGFFELLAKGVAEKATLGRKCHMKASFDEEGNCTAYPYTSTLKQW